MLSSMNVITLSTVSIILLCFILALVFPGRQVLEVEPSSYALVHVLLSIVTAGVLGVAGLQAILLAIQERLLRHRPHGVLIQKLPPLVSMEKIVFKTIAVGFLLLSFLLASSIYFFHEELWGNPFLWQKAILVVSAWVIFALLLMGRHFWGWRGRKAIYGTLCGVLLLILVYFGSKLLLEGLH
ncbi:cytochrome C assembly family protein [Coxiella burnetii]|uniref:cytochrome C assembly family protein n=1 Tax=Coxiella burnetii TaxID=777 RepID=UPI000BFC1E70|nr:cytochrome c biogenesis protein CcsA [Coxiella burnetii]PHH57313.1 cytochrome C assembly protein [Coxiella burnetii]